MKRVLIAGGGITGLSLAYFLSKHPDLSVTLVEPSGRLGGSIRTIERDGFLLEAGADSFLSEKKEALALCRELGLEGELCGTRERYRKARVAAGGRLIEVPKGFYLMAPTDFGSFLASPLLSAAGKWRAIAEIGVARRAPGGDESVASFIRRRFGKELLEKIGQPMVAGIYTGDPEQLSLRATFPRFLDLEARYGSVVRGLLREKRGSADARGPRYGLFLSFRRGMETLVRALAARVPAAAIHFTRLESIRKNAGGGWSGKLSNGAVLDADAVCLTVPARAAAPLLKEEDAALAALLEEIRCESVATVNLAFGPGAFGRAPDAAGFVVPASEGRSIVAATFADLKFEGRTPEGSRLVRAFVGGAFGRGHFQKSDGEMVDSVLKDLQDLAGVGAAGRARLQFAEVHRHPDAMVQYTLGHLERTERIESAAAGHRGLYLAGSSYRGIGIPDCIAQAEKTADKMSKEIA